tara:strand:- start:2058 stop:2192 length:135 start_codon:yes stop_codon:yes gene_type:complete
MMHNRGFEIMIPQPKEEVSLIHHHEIKFSLFGRTFSFRIKVTKE